MYVLYCSSSGIIHTRISESAQETGTDESPTIAWEGWRRWGRRENDTKTKDERWSETKSSNGISGTKRVVATCQLTSTHHQQRLEVAINFDTGERWERGTVQVQKSDTVGDE